MRLISALASSFLFVPIVLADDLVLWAGASLEGNEGSYNFTTGTFNAPLVWGDNNRGVAVTVGIHCPGSNISFTVGIDVLSSNNYPVSYTAWAKWGAQLKWPPKFDIHTGDFIQASVTVLSATTGSASLENLFTGAVWKEDFSADEHAVQCQQPESAKWAVTALADYSTNLNVVPIPKFSTVSFLNATAKTASEASVMAGGAKSNNIKFNTTVLTTVMAVEDVIVVGCEMY